MTFEPGDYVYINGKKWIIKSVGKIFNEILGDVDEVTIVSDTSDNEYTIKEPWLEMIRDGKTND